jgi:carbamoyltransferase
VALNCVANYEILRRTPWKRIWAQPAAHDAGGALGAALAIWNLELGHSWRVPFPNAFLGPEFSAERCELALLRAGLPYSRPSRLAERTAQSLGQGGIVARFSGRMEFGPRALGNRSILADPRSPNVKSKLNRIIKEREPFRPFAASVLEAATTGLFEHTPQDTQTDPTSFMLFAVPVRNGTADALPAVVHRNRSTGQAFSRIHVVKQPDNPAYYEVLECFRDQSGCAALLNTSFNIAEPIVCTPEDAVSTFVRSSLDAMTLGPYFVERRTSP